jgi:hypothetical protein
MMATANLRRAPAPASVPPRPALVPELEIPESIDELLINAAVEVEICELASAYYRYALRLGKTEDFALGFTTRVLHHLRQLWVTLKLGLPVILEELADERSRLQLDFFANNSEWLAYYENPRRLRRALLDLGGL